jgi:signal transduction histidine kinase/ligand-binding sensor domain-containing protein
MLKLRLCYIVYWMLAAASLGAQSHKRFSFAHYGPSSGLASNDVFATTQDRQGFIWVGTTNGLQRYDGIRFMTFSHKKNDPTTIPGNFVSQLLMDGKDHLWIQSAGDRVGIFDIKKFSYQDVAIHASDELYAKNEKWLRLDEEGNMMLVVGNLELLTYNEQRKEFSPTHNFIPFPPGWKGLVDVYNIPGTKKYIVGTHHGIFIYNKATKRLSYPGHNVENEKLIDALGSITGALHYLLDKKGRLWFDNWESGMPAIFCYDLRNNKVLLNSYRIYPIVNTYHEVRGFLEQKDGTIWVKGLAVFAFYQEDRNEFVGVYNKYENEQSIAFNKINDLFEDNERNIWVATNNNGLFRFNPAEQFFTNIRHINRITNNPGEGGVMSFIETKWGTMLAGAWGDGTYQYDKNLKLLPLNLKGLGEKANPSAWSMTASRDGKTIYIGAQPGVIIIDQDKRTAVHHTPEILQNRTVRQVAEDKLGNLWIGTQSLGLFKWDKEKGKVRFADGVRHFEDVPSMMILKITTDPNGNVWVATSNSGAYVIDPVTDKVILHLGTRERAERNLLFDGVGSVLSYDDSTMIIAANGLHLFNIKKQRIIKTISLPESVPGSIMAMERDRQGYLWVSMTSGLFRINLKSEIFIYFDRKDGIVNDQFVIAASYALSDGRLLFGADNQFVIFDPSQVKLTDAAPPVAITGFALMNRPLNVDSLLKKNLIELSPKENSISIDFSGLRYNGTYIIKYKLDKLEKEWKLADKDQRAIYSYLPPGTYTFMLQSEDAEGKPSGNITQLKIKVKPPFWKTWWFLGLVIFAATAVLFWLDKLRIQKLRATETVRTRIATSLTEDMSSSLTNINISSELAKTKVDTDSKRTKEYIAQISETSNRMVQAMYDMVWSIDPKNDTMVNTIERMKNFAVEIENTYPLSIDFDIDRQVERLELDMENRYEILCIYKEALMNAAKHSDGRHVKVSMRYNKPKLMLMILDDGRGFSMDDAAMLGRGLSDMRRRAAAINAVLYLESEINTGTIVKLEVPV